MKPIVYLAGPITGLSFSSATSWRVAAQKRLETCGIQCANPLRGYGHLENEEAIKHTYLGHQFMTQRGTVARDYFDVKRSSLLLVNLLGAPKVSAGTISELAWAWHLRKLVIVVMEKTGNPHDGHPMIMEFIDFRYDNIDAGIDSACIAVGEG